ncbi:DHH family phosphoesterase [Candidatus Woesearchaeota archaeon]|nr:DHH family phosphoesterase [Candidatus Woesearchaeota archaeon]
MSLTTKQIKELKEELDNCKKPIYFFDDDPDGLCSFLLFYRYKREGKGVIIKRAPGLDYTFAKKAIEYGADKIFILDKPKIEESFIENIPKKIPIVWLDHHLPQKTTSNIKYFNPKIANLDELRPTSYWAYLAVQQDLWIATIGCVSDWTVPKDILTTFKKEYPSIMPKLPKDPSQALYEQTIGKLSRLYSFLLKGAIKDIDKSIKILTRIKTPQELLDNTTPAANYLHKRFEKINVEYKELFAKANKKTKSKLLHFNYFETSNSFTGDISNELIYYNPEKLIIVSRKKGDDMRMSLRSGTIKVRPILEKALIGVDGHGGGHLHACGASVKTKDFDKFLQTIKEELGEK